MKKMRTLLKAPVLTQSGYGVHARQLFEALYNDPFFDLYVESIQWGHTPFLTKKTKEKQRILECVNKFVVARAQNQNDYDLFIHVTIPNEFEKRGKFNIGVTAGIETDRISHVWVQKCNEMDVIIVPSEHSRKVFDATVIQWKNQQTGESGEFKITKPVIVCNEGVNTEIFKKNTELTTTIANLEFESDFNFLHIGQWGKGGFGEDRKNIGNLVKYFIETFKGRKDVGLVLKSNMARNSVADHENILNRLKEIKSFFKEEEIPPIYLVHGSLTDEELSDLYNHPKIKAFVSLTKGEGYGLPLIEAAACELPVVATNWSGHLDFLKPGLFSAVDYELTEIPDSVVWDTILIKGSKWASAKEDDAKRRMKKMVSAYSKPQEWAKELADHVKENFNLKTVQQQFIDTIKLSLTEATTNATFNPEEHLRSFVDTPDAFNVLYTMPRSAGDVFVSTAVIDGLMKAVPEDAKLYFATSPQYADILQGNPHVHKVLPWNQSMLSVDLTEKIFDLVLTPDTATQYNFSNWIRRGQGRLLAEELANHCHVELGEYFIEKENYENLPETYMTIHVTSGTGQWEARNYKDWKEVAHNLKNLYPELQIVQIGQEDEPKLEESDVDLRGKTNYQQLAGVLQNSMLHLGVDSFPIHLASALNTPLVALYGCSYASSTGPWVKDRASAKYVLLQSERLSGCRDKACYKNRCISNPEGNGPINEIDPKEVFQACVRLLQEHE